MAADLTAGLAQTAMEIEVLKQQQESVKGIAMRWKGAAALLRNGRSLPHPNSLINGWHAALAAEQVPLPSQSRVRVQLAQCLGSPHTQTPISASHLQARAGLPDTPLAAIELQLHEFASEPKPQITVEKSGSGVLRVTAVQAPALRTRTVDLARQLMTDEAAQVAAQFAGRLGGEPAAKRQRSGASDGAIPPPPPVDAPPPPPPPAELEQMICAPSSRERAQQKQGAEILGLIQKPTMREQRKLNDFQSQVIAVQCAGAVCECSVQCVLVQCAGAVR